MPTESHNASHPLPALNQLCAHIRDIIGNPRKRHAIQTNPRMWDQACSSLDVIEDSQLAISSYTETDCGSNEGDHYLRIYGLLQACFLQQDAVKHLAEGMKIPFSTDPDLQRVRDIRNNAIGHPTKRGGSNQTTFFYLSRISISKWGFDLLHASPELGDTFHHIDLAQCLQWQQDGITRGCQLIWDQLENEEITHRQEFAAMSLTQIFPPNIQYLFQKIYEGINAPKKMDIARIAIDSITAAYQNFRQELISRKELPANRNVEEELQDVEYAIGRLYTFFQEGETQNFSSKDANIFAFFIQHRHPTIVKMAEEIDQEYQESAASLSEPSP